jgi:hypothetical protein
MPPRADTATPRGAGLTRGIGIAVALAVGIPGILVAWYSAGVALFGARDRDAHVFGVFASLVVLFAARALVVRTHTGAQLVGWGLLSAAGLAGSYLAIDVIPSRRAVVASPSPSVDVSRARGAYVRSFVLATPSVVMGADTVELEAAWLERVLTTRWLFWTSPTSAQQVVVRASTAAPSGELWLGAPSQPMEAVPVRHGWRRPPFILSGPAERALPDTLKAEVR